MCRNVGTNQGANMKGEGKAEVVAGQAVDVAARKVDLRGGDDEELLRAVPVEVPISIEVCGIAYAVMMATPADLRDYVTGFALNEGLVDEADDIEALDIVQVEGGWVARMTIPADRTERVMERARQRVTESSCGICGMDNIEQILRALPPVKAATPTSRDAIARALATIYDHQPLGQLTGAVHAAAFCTTDGTIQMVREDVGRHNAFDKLVGAMALAGMDAGAGFVLLTARCSYELVEKAVRSGCTMLVTISAPTSLAVERAKLAGLTLVTLARRDTVLVMNDPHAIIR